MPNDRIRTDMVGQLDLLSHDTVGGWATTVARCWQLACEHDGVDPANRFVAFSPDNPIAPFYSIAVLRWQESITTSASLGYTGLAILDGKAGIPKRKASGRKRKG